MSNVTISPAQLELVLRRLGIPRGQVTLLKALYEADAFVPRSDLIERVRWGDAKSFSGVLAAFTNRVNNTEGLKEASPGCAAFIEQRKIDGTMHLRLRPEARQAVEHVPELLEAFDQPMEELLEGITVDAGKLSLCEDRARQAGREPISKWSATTLEDRLVRAYWERVGGTIITEVETGGSGPSNWPDGARRRRIDGVRFLHEGRDEICSPSSLSQSALREIVHRRHVEVIEAKKTLNRPVIGQAIAGRDLFQRDYSPATVEPVVLVRKTDPALEWVCRRNGIRVLVIAPVEPRQR